ncbi:MAG: DUF2085 domain-containing protein [Chloroflexi bacterium]|nr:DUF2085 domain-containing protein [Chloroflexota bacterium]
MITVTLYSKSNCSLCDQAREDLEALSRNYPHTLAEVDIEADLDLQSIYKDRVPVLQVGPYTLEAPFDRQKIEMTLGAARDRLAQAASDSELNARRQRGARFNGADRFTQWFSRSYMLVINFLLVLYVGLPFLAPVLMNAGLPAAARPIYTVYGAVCHQLAFRSWFLFGDQSVYPRAAAEVDGAATYGQVTGLDEEDLLAARRFVGNEEIGYKVAFCERDAAIYGAMLLFGITFALTGRRIKSLPWFLWILIGIAPIAIDGFSQLLSQLPGFFFWPYRESTPLLRTLTGGLFGFTTAWFGFPLIEESMGETRKMLAAKKARLGQNG